MILVRYGEISLKGRNREVFEDKLVENIYKHLSREGQSAIIKKYRGRILVYTAADPNILKNVLGIVSISKAVETDLEIDRIYDHICKLIKSKDPKTFRISTQRLWKGFKYTSVELNNIFGEKVINDFGLKVNLKNPELEIGIEITDSHAYVFSDRIPGFGGLPVGIEGTIIALFSGGIDSPVAAWMVMKRGAKIVLLNFFHNQEQLQKVIETAHILDRYSPDPIEFIAEDHGALINNFIHNLYYIKKQRWTCVFCRYSMLKRAEELSHEKNALAIVTGESLGQVASQTLNNINVESSAVNMPILRPLVGLDKIEIESIAKKIGTYEKSIIAKGCSCPFLPDYPVTKADYESFKKIETQAFAKRDVPKVEIVRQSNHTC
ncbi:MAG: tRNA uracil 4-sulfurtransferase ThiI [Thermoplasmata archaeon]